MHQVSSSKITTSGSRVDPRSRPRPPALLLVLGLVLGLVLSGLVAGPASVVPAHADTQPPAPGTPETVTADALPTWQVTGVVWAQIIVGNTAYATGSFTRARPPGVPAGGAGEITVGHLIAYDVRTGERIAGFDHVLNAQGHALATSPDKTRLYVGGDFTAVDGQVRQHVAAFNVATGALESWNPVVNGSARVITTSGGTVYVGGAFESAGGQPRKRLAALTATTGALLPWAPQANDGYVYGMVVTPDASKVVIGGQFTQLNGTTVGSMGAVDATTGALLPWPATAHLRASVTETLTTDGTSIFGVGRGGVAQMTNFEGPFSLTPDGTVRWLADCLGDSYDVALAGPVVYTASHHHNCQLIGGYPESSTQGRWQHANAFTSAATGVNDGPSAYGWTHKGEPAPTLLQWFPQLGIGTVTGQHQAAWSVAANADYVVYGGEFPTVNGKAQAGLTRFAVKTKAPDAVGPQYDGTVPTRDVPPTTTSLPAPGAVRITFGAAWDKDNQRLTYRVYRDRGTAAQKLVRTLTAETTFWTLPTLNAIDPSAPPGSHTYQVQVTDPYDNELWSPVSAPVTASGTSQSYWSRVVDDGADRYWRLQSGFPTDLVTGFVGSSPGGVTYGAAGALIVDPNPAATLSGGSTGYFVDSSPTTPAPRTFSVEAWFRTTSTSGGRLVGFGDQRTGPSTTDDRHVYLTDTGRVVFGVRAATVKTVTSAAGFNDGQWHHVVASLGSTGLRLSLDGSPVAADASVTTAVTYRGSWRVGGDQLTGWPNAPTSSNLAATVDEVATYPTVLTAAQIADHYARSGRGQVNQLPHAVVTVTGTGSTRTLSAAGSTDADGTITSYAWKLGDGQTATGASVTHTYAAAGTYPVELTVTDDDGGTDTATASVEVGGVFARDAFARTVATGWGTADQGGAWVLSGTSSLYAVANGWGTIRMAAAGSGPAARLPVSSADTDLQLQLAFDKPPTGGGQFVRAVVRGDTSNGYMARVWVSSSGSMTLFLTRVVGGTETDLGSVVLTGTTFVAGQAYALRVQAWGTAPTTLRAKAWRAADPEPTTWPLTRTDTTAGLQVPGGIAVRGYLSSSATGAPVVLSIRSLTARTTGN